MKNKYFILIITIICLLILSCEHDSDNRFVPANQLISSITSKSDKKNILHVIIEVVYKENAKAEIEYWKKKLPNEKRKITSDTDLKENQTLDLFFLEAETEYEFKLTVKGRNTYAETKTYTFKTGKLPASVPEYEIKKNELNESINGYIVLTRQTSPCVISLINQKGKVVWYYIGNDKLKRANYDFKTKTFLCLGAVESTFKTKIFNKLFVVDLYGNKTVVAHETKTPLMHHDAIRTKNGNFAVINYVPKTFDLTALGGKKQQVVYGDGITIYNKNSEKIWTWNCFSERTPKNDKKILTTWINGKKRVDDWLHANAIYEDDDGNFLISFNFISEVWKINKKTKIVIWRLGKNGTLKSNHQIEFMQGNHSVRTTNNNPQSIHLLDNGIKKRQSRYLNFHVDEEKKTIKKIDETKFPETYFTKFMGNAIPINEKWILFGSSMTKNILITTTTGKLLWRCEVPYTFFRAQFIPFSDLY